MKKILLMIGVILSSSMLVSCIGIGYEDIVKMNTAWSSDDKKLEFQMQGYNYSNGIGYIIVNKETVEVSIILNAVRHKLTLFKYEDGLDGEKVREYMVFDIDLYGSGLKREQDRIKLTLTTNNSTDNSFEDSFDIHRRDLEENEIDVKYYSMTSFENIDLGFKLLRTRQSDFTNIVAGTIKYHQLDLEIEFHFLDDHEFEVYVLNELILSGTYKTNGFKLVLEFLVNHIYGDRNTLTLSAVEG